MRRCHAPRDVQRALTAAAVSSAVLAGAAPPPPTLGSAVPEAACLECLSLVQGGVRVSAGAAGALAADSSLRLYSEEGWASRWAADWGAGRMALDAATGSQQEDGLPDWVIAADNGSSPVVQLSGGAQAQLPGTRSTARGRKEFPLSSANRPVTMWDIILFGCTMTVPFLMAGARLVMIKIKKHEAVAEAVAGDAPLPQPEIRRQDSYYIEESKREETGKLHTFLSGSDPDEPPQGTVVKNVLSGIVCALGCLPESISFSLIAGVSPLNGIWAGVFMALSDALGGGCPGLISSSSASTAVVLVQITKDPELGVGPMAVAVLICGIIQAFVGVLRLARFTSLIPQPVMLGFINGLAIVIGISQIDHFRKAGAGTSFVDKEVIWGMLLTALISLGIAWVYPRIPVIGKFLPGSFVGVFFAILFGLFVSPFPNRTLEQVAGKGIFEGSINMLPPWNFPPLGVDWRDKYMWHKAIFTGVRLAIVGLVESLVTLMIVDQITETHGSTTRECYGQSLGNILSGIFGVQGGCALIGQTLINVSGGGRGRLSGITMAIVLFLCVVVFAPAVGQIPVAALVGLALLVAINTFAWGTIGAIRRAGIQWTDGIVIALVMMVTIFLDLAIALVLGIVVSTLMFAWNVSKTVRLEEYVDRVLDTRTFLLHGPLFFGSAVDFQKRFEVSSIPQKQVVLDFSHGNVLDHSGAEAIASVITRLQEGGKHVELIGLNVDAKEFVRCIWHLPGD